MKFYLILSCLFSFAIINAQPILPPFGNFSSEEINLKECAFDKNAEAVVLFDYAVADHDEDYKLITHRRVRIKILHQREADRGNIKIRFYSKDKFEHITNVKGVTLNLEGGQPVYTYLNNKSIYTEKEDNVFSYVKFALPNVKEGSIIEYEFDSIMEHYGGLSSWLFQDDIPTIKSGYLLTILPNTQFQYNVQKKVKYPIVINPIKDQGKIYFEMNNIPGLKQEPYMDAINDYLQKVEFQLAEFTRYGKKTQTNQTWKDLAYDLLNEKYFGGVIKKDLSKIDDVKSLVALESTDSGKVSAIYNYVRNNIVWNGYHSKYAMDGLKTVWEKRTGNAGEINLLLINLLQTFNIEVYPLLIAERDFGKIDTTYPFIDRFNKVAAYAKADGRTFILDATQKFTPPGLTPYPLLNTIAFLVDKKDFRLIRLLTSRNVYNNTITVKAKIDDNGLLEGTSEIISSGYAKQVRTEKIKTDPKSYNTEILQEQNSDLIVDNFRFENLDEDDKPLIQKIEFHNEQNVSGGFIFFTPNMFTGYSKNPFTANERFTNVNFGYPSDITLKATIQLPEKAKIDKLPADKETTFGNKFIIVSRKMKVENNTLVVTLGIKQTITLVQNDQYASLKGIFKQLTEMLNDPVIIKVN